MPYLIIFVAQEYLNINLIPVDAPQSQRQQKLTFLATQIATFSGLLSLMSQLFTSVAELAGLVNRVGQALEVFTELQKSELFAHSQTHTHLNPMSDPTAVTVKNMTIETPPRFGHRVLVTDLSFVAKPGQSIVIVGPSGCGKSSVLRVLGSLWPFSEGDLSKPEAVCRDGVFFFPQKPYVTETTLRELVLYPDELRVTSHDASAPDSSFSSASATAADTRIRQVLEQVDLHYLVTMGLDAHAPWADILSMGEQQRLGFARLLYHRPRVVIMDESTSALDMVIQEKCLRACADEGMVMISVAHRPSGEVFAC
jgi:ABC-type uncharacterized transport system fused permease/ATPase subunit